MGTDAALSTENSDSPNSKPIDWPPALGRLLLGAVVGSVLGWLTLSVTYPIFVVPPEIAILPDPPPKASVEKLEAALFVVNSKNFAISFSLIGLLIGVTSAFFTYGFRYPGRIVCSGLLGAIFCVIGILICNVFITRARASGGNDIILLGITLDDLKQTILSQACMWGLTGLGIGLGLGRNLKTSIVAGISGLVGGALAAMLYGVGMAVIAPNAGTFLPFPEAKFDRAIWMVFAAAIIALTIGMGTGERAKKAKPA